MMEAATGSPRLYDLCPGRTTGMLDQAGQLVREGDEVLYFNHPERPEGIRGVVRMAAWSELSPRVQDGWVVVFESRIFAGVTAAFSATEHGIRKL
jgi:KaiC/GvpD/RAD55 family RecA-like ATPase